MSADVRVLRFLAAGHDRVLAELIEFASIPSVSTDPAHAGDVQTAARWVADTPSARLVTYDAGHELTECLEEMTDEARRFLATVPASSGCFRGA